MAQQVQNKLEAAQLLLYTQIEELQNSPDAHTPEVQAKIAELQLTIDNAEKFQDFLSAQFPDLPEPVVDLESLKKLVGGAAISAEALLEALSLQERKNAIQETLNSIEARSEEKKAASTEKLEEIKKKIEDERKSDVLNWFEKAFKWVGLVAGAIAAVAGMITGAAGMILGGSGALLATGSAILLAVCIDGIVSEATGGEHSMTKAITDSLVKHHGLDESTAQIIAMAIQAVIVIIACCMTFGGSATSVADAADDVSAMALKIAEKIESFAPKLKNIGSGIAGVAQIGTGATGIVNAHIQLSLDKSDAFMKELEALMESLQLSDEMDMRTVEALMEQMNELISSVQEIVDTMNAGAQAIMGNSPSMA